MNCLESNPVPTEQIFDTANERGWNVSGSQVHEHIESKGHSLFERGGGHGKSKNGKHGRATRKRQILSGGNQMRFKQEDGGQINNG